jgi:hypothetical protein
MGFIWIYRTGRVSLLSVFISAIDNSETGLAVGMANKQILLTVQTSFD